MREDDFPDLDKKQDPSICALVPLLPTWENELGDEGIPTHPQIPADPKLSQDPYDWIDRSLNTIHKAQWYRSPANIQVSQGSYITVAGKQLLNFASNDYLGLAIDPRLKAAAIAAIQTYGTGSTGSRLVTGQRPLHRELEESIARLKKSSDALVFSSGYAANLGTIAALVGDRDLIIADQYNHSSLKNGAILSRAKVLEYRHCDLVHLRELLENYRNRSRRCLLVTDTVFSMDGDLCPLPEIMELATEFDCMVLVDEAHGTGVLGATGAGAIEHFKLDPDRIVCIGTLSKALGSLGGYVSGSAKLIDFLRNRCASWIYTTALSPADTAAALKAIELITTQPAIRQQLWQNIEYFKKLLAATSIKILPSDSAIICWELSDAQTALQMSQMLSDQGIFAPAIRPPTVPTSRIRFTLTANHRSADIEKLATVLE
jgi:8-amino-7-oxononanoate synthase